MHRTDQQGSLGEACPASSSRPTEAGPRNPQASYYRARYYDQSTGRFLSEDKIGFDGGVNFYSYVYNQPTNYSDPSGFRPYKCNFMGDCTKIPFGWKPYRPPPVPNPNNAGSSIVDQQLQAYRNCVASGIKGIQDPPPRPNDDPSLGMLKATSNTMKPKPMPGDPSGPFAFPNPSPNPLGADDGLGMVDELTRMYNCQKRGRVADNCADRFPLAKLSGQF